MIAGFDRVKQNTMPNNIQGAELLVLAAEKKGGTDPIPFDTAGMAYFNAESLRLAALREFS